MGELSSDTFGICFDTGHCNLFTTISLEKWLDSIGRYIFSLHLHDNDKTFDSHLSIGDGTFEFGRLFSLLKDGHYVYTIEAHTPEGVLKSIERLKGYTG